MLLGLPVAVPLSRKSWIFVTSDCITFFMQISGSGLGASDSLAKVGSTVTLIGIIAQLVSFVIFTFVPPTTPSVSSRSVLTQSWPSSSSLVLSYVDWSLSTGDGVSLTLLVAHASVEIY